MWTSAVLQRCGDHPCPPDGCERDLQRQPAGPSASGPVAGSGLPGSVHRAVRGSGQPLAPHARRLLEPRFGADLSSVRVHADAESTRDVQAAAYTLGEHVVFAPGRYAAGTPAGMRLLAHELTHVLQQRRGTLRPQRAGGVSHPQGADEREAAAVADRVLAGGHAGPIAATPTGVQRTISATPIETTKPGARVCLVHLHGDEGNSRQTAKDLQRGFCANMVDLPGTDRNVPITGLPRPRGCAFDPNRVFTPSGIANHAILPARCRVSAATSDLAAWSSGTLVPAISRCRGGGGGSLTDGTLPVVAFHNNAVRRGGGGLSIRSYRPGGAEAHATETDPTRLRGGATTGPVPANPSQLAAGAAHADPHNFLLVTDPSDYAAFRGTFNVVLQEDTVATTGPTQTPGMTDDGSLSVALRGDRYVNIEARDKPFRGRRTPAFVENLAMGTEALTIMGIPRVCPQPVLQRDDGGPVPDAGPLPDTAPTQAAEPEEATEPGLLERIIRFVERLIDEIRRVLRQGETLPTPLPQEGVPSPAPAGCHVFANQAELDTRKTHFAGQLAGMTDADIIEWIVGVNRPPRWTTTEVTAQRDCMVAALRRAARRPGSTISMTRQATVASGYRSFADQERIWNRKFDFVRGQGTFGRITDAARSACSSLPAADLEWNPDDAVHRACWASLSDDQKQREILVTSSGPGTSRHHWGTDVDLWSTSPAEFEAGGPLADEYSWLMRNAATYGYIQTFTPLSTFMRLGYTEERWHWSYYPIAQALLEWADAHRADIDTRVTALWAGRGRFSFLAAHWQEFVFNVSQAGVF